MTRFYMGTLQGLSMGFLACAILDPDAVGGVLLALGAALQVLYWLLKIKQERKANGKT